ncbi:INO80 complex subunit D [Linum grandiflorum]
MTASAKLQHHSQAPSTSKPSRNNLNPSAAAVAPHAPPQTTNPNPTSSAAAATSAATSPITLYDQNHPLSHATLLTRHELLKRRSHHLKQLLQCYKDHYWALMEEVKVQHREYYWKYGVSPIKDDQKQEDPGSNFVEGGENGNIVEVMDESNNFGNGVGGNLPCSNTNNSNSSKRAIELKNIQSSRCTHVSTGTQCKLKAMALTSFCSLHILDDTKQKLYKACTFVLRSASAGPLICGRPILQTTAPSLCTLHFQKAQQHVTRALKKAGLNVTASSKVAPKFHVIVSEYVNQIQAKRRAARRLKSNKDVDNDAKGSGGNGSVVKS